MDTRRPADQTSAIAFAGMGLGLLSLGLWLDVWWPIAGGMWSLAAAAWYATQPPA